MKRVCILRDTLKKKTEKDEMNDDIIKKGTYLYLRNVNTFHLLICLIQ